MAVGPLVLLAEGFLEMGDHAGIDRAVGHRHGELVALALVMQRRGALEPGAGAAEAFDGELFARLPRQGVPGAVDLAEIGLAQQPPEGARVVMLDVGIEQAERGEQAGRGRHDDAA